MITRISILIIATAMLTVPAHAASNSLSANSPTQKRGLTSKPPGSQLMLVANKFSAPRSIKVGPKGNQKIMTKSELRGKNPSVFKLYEKTERAALDFHAKGGGGVPSGCTLNPGHIHCTGFGWYCNFRWNGTPSNCGRLPPFIPKRP